MSRRRRPLTEAEAQRLQAQAARLPAQGRGKQGLSAPKPNKFHAQPVTVNGIRYGSEREAERAAELQWMERLGLITDLVLDKRRLHYDLVVNGTTIGTYTPDFRYWENGALVIEDVKSGPTRTREYRRNRKWMKALYGIEIREIGV